VYVYGRRDATISVMGANIYPEDLETIIYGDPNLAGRLQSFLLMLLNDDTGTPRPGIALELIGTAALDEPWQADISTRLREGLRNLNLDYREAFLEYPTAMEPIVSVHPLGTGPFAEDASRIKPRRIVSAAPPAGA